MTTNRLTRNASRRKPWLLKPGNDVTMDKKDLMPDCPECDENAYVRSLGIVEYGADYEDDQWFEKCSYYYSFYCGECNVQFLTDEAD